MRLAKGEGVSTYFLRYAFLSWSSESVGEAPRRSLREAGVLCQRRSSSAEREEGATH